MEGGELQNLLRKFVLLSSILISGCAGPSGKSFDSAMGEWSSQIHPPYGASKFAKLTIIDETKATYTWMNGRIFFYAIDDQDKWEGYRVENSGAHDCADKKDGSTDWGAVKNSIGTASGSECLR